MIFLFFFLKNKYTNKVHRAEKKPSNMMHFLGLQHQYRIETCAESLKYCQLNGETILVLGNILSVFSSYKRGKSN